MDLREVPVACGTEALLKRGDEEKNSFESFYGKGKI
jgi:hypothetical protein